MAKKTRLGPEKMTISEWEDIMTDWYHSQLGFGAQFVSDVINSAHGVEGGWCYGEVMAPHMRLILGEMYWNLVAFS